MKIVILIIALIALIALETTAFAQPSPEDLYTEGQKAYDRADYKTAIEKWQAAYDLSKERALLFNLAQAKRLSGDCTGALTIYRRFITDNPDPIADEQHKLAEDLARELEGTCPPQKAAITMPPKEVPARASSAEDRARPGRAWKTAGLVTGGAGVVTLVIGLGLGHRGAAIGDEITAACTTSCDWATIKDKDARGRREVTLGKMLDVIGIAAIAGGAVFYYLGVRQETIAVTPTAHGGGILSWKGVW